MIRVGALPILVSKESASECAGSVDITSVRLPAFAERTAVAAATVVLPTPPLPVNRMTRIRAAYLAALRRQRVARMARTATTLMVACAAIAATSVQSMLEDRGEDHPHRHEPEEPDRLDVHEREE